MEKKVKATARVQVTVEVEDSAWGGDCSIGQLYKQAGEGSINKVRNLMASGQFSRGDVPFRIIGEPKVIGVITEES